MRVLIIEDEILAQAKLEAMLLQLEPSSVIVGKTSSVQESIEWLKTYPAPDVAFVDIQLSDDHSFEIFRQTTVTFPVIFTTAYDQYLLESFEFNSIDYLLKPILEEKLQRSLSKLKKFEHHFTHTNISKAINDISKSSLERLVVKKGTDFLTLNVHEIAYFFTEHRIVFVKDINGKQYIVDRNLAELESGLDQKNFFRINRKYIANISAIEKFRSDNGKIKIALKPPVNEDVHVSKETAPEFRKWIGVTD